MMMIISSQYHCRFHFLLSNNVVHKVISLVHSYINPSNNCINLSSDNDNKNYDYNNNSDKDKKDRNHFQNKINPVPGST